MPKDEPIMEEPLAAFLESLRKSQEEDDRTAPDDPEEQQLVLDKAIDRGQEHYERRLRAS